MHVAKKIADRIAHGLKRLVPIIQQQQARDVSEADTVTLVKDVLAEVLGYDKYADLTSELAIRGTYCDLGVRIDDKIAELVEVKAIGLSLNDRHLKQAVDYAANQGIEWVILTNAVTWQLHHVVFSKPIDHRQIAEIDLTKIDWRKAGDVELIYAFTKEGLKKGIPGDLRDKHDATSRYLLAALLLQNESVIGVLRRELRKVVDVNVTDDEIHRVLEADVVKRDTLEGPSAEQAIARIKRAAKKAAKSDSKSTPAVDRISSGATASETNAAESATRPEASDNS